MSTYSIKELEQLSGIKAHTIRVWEQRYNLLSPKRTETNIRYYDDVDLKLILNVALLNEQGYRISKIASMTAEQMRDQVMHLTERSLTHDDQLYALTTSMIDLDEERFEKVLSSNIMKLGFEQTMLQIVYPFMSKVGLLWQTGTINPAQEHFISNLVRQKLIVAIDAQLIRTGGKKFLLYLPEAELHEITLLFASYLLKNKGHKVIYLGQNTPEDDLLSVFELHQPDFLMTSITTSPSPEAIQGYIDGIATRFGKAKILITGYQVVRHDLQFPANVLPFNYIRDFKKWLADL